MLKRTWLVTEALSQNDVEWLLRSRIEYDLGDQHYEVIDVGIHGSSPVSLPTYCDPVKIYTYNDKEETWLKLYFADRLIISEEDYYYSERFYT